MRVEGARELRLDTGNNSHSHSSDSSIGLARLILSIRLGCQWILPLLLLFHTPVPPLSHRHPPTPSLLRQPFEEGWKVLPGGGSDDTSQGQDMATDVGRASDGVAADKAKAAFSEWKIDLP